MRISNWSFLFVCIYRDRSTWFRMFQIMSLQITHFQVHEAPPHRFLCLIIIITFRESENAVLLSGCNSTYKSRGYFVFFFFRAHFFVFFPLPQLPTAYASEKMQVTISLNELKWMNDRLAWHGNIVKVTTHCRFYVRIHATYSFHVKPPATFRFGDVFVASQSALELINVKALYVRLSLCVLSKWSN